MQSMKGMRDSVPSFEMAATFSVLTVQLLEDPCFPASPASSLVHLGTITAQLCIAGHPLTADCLFVHREERWRQRASKSCSESHSLLVVQLVLNSGTQEIGGKATVCSVQAVSEPAVAGSCPVAQPSPGLAWPPPDIPSSWSCTNCFLLVSLPSSSHCSWQLHTL